MGGMIKPGISVTGLDKRMKRQRKEKEHITSVESLVSQLRYYMTDMY